MDDFINRDAARKAIAGLLMVPADNATHITRVTTEIHNNAVEFALKILAVLPALTRDAARQALGDK